MKMFKCNRKMDHGEIILLREEIFNKLMNENFLYTILADEHVNGEMSKSYYHHIIRFLKQLGIMKDSKVNFKLIAPFNLSAEDKLTVSPSFLYCKDNTLFVVDYRAVYHKCVNCPFYLECKTFLDTIKGEFKLKSRSHNQRERLKELLTQLNEKILSRSKIIIIDEK